MSSRRTHRGQAHKLHTLRGSTQFHKGMAKLIRLNEELHERQASARRRRQGKS